MSDPHLPPPPGFGSQPPPPPPGYGTPAQPPFSYGTPPPPSFQPGPPGAYPSAPPGYVAYGQPSTLQLSQPVGLRKATVVLFWVVNAASLIFGLVAYQRGNVARDLLEGVGSVTSVRDADHRAGGAAALWLVAMLAAAIVLAIWASRTVGNAKRRDPSNPASPGLAAGGWFIPIGNLFVPFQQLRNASRGSTSAGSAIGIWQGCFVAGQILYVVARVRADVNSETVLDAESRLHQQGLLLVAMTVAFVIGTIFAQRAMKAIDAQTAGVNPV